MSEESRAVLRALVRAARPWLLLASAVFYALGGGIAHFLGTRIDWPVYWLGSAAVTMLLLSSFWLAEYFERSSQPPFEQVVRKRTLPRPEKRKPVLPPPDWELDLPAPDPEETPPPEVVEVIVPRVIFLQTAAAALTIGAVMTVLLMTENSLNPGTITLLGIALLLGLAYAVPPVRLVGLGYGELVVAILVANLFPALGYLFQVGDLHRLLALLSLPLTFLLLAAMLARSLQGYLEDVRRDRQTMMVRIGWQTGMTLHNALIATAYIALAVGVITGLSERLAYPVFLSLPVGLFQIWQMNRIAAGTKPRWRLLAVTALATVGLAVYFMNFALWTS